LKISVENHSDTTTEQSILRTTEGHVLTSSTMHCVCAVCVIKEIKGKIFEDKFSRFVIDPQKKNAKYLVLKNFLSYSVSES